MKPICENVVPTDEISDHDMPFVILNIKSLKFQPHYMMICGFTNFELENYIKDFERLPLSLVYVSDDPDDQVSFLNNLILQCINKHAPLKRTKITHLPAPWMKSVSIKYLQSERIKLRKIAYETKNENSMQNDRPARTCLKQTIKAEKKKFYKTALSSKKKKKDVWKTIHRILKPSPKSITGLPNDLNNYLSDIAENLTGKSPETIYKSNLPDENYKIF